MTLLDRLLGRHGERPAESFSEALQQERTSLAWERTAIALMIAATLLARYAAGDGVWLLAGAAFALAAAGGGLLVWSGVHYDNLHEPLRSGASIDHHRPIKLVALGTVGVTSAGLLLSLWLALTG